MAIRKSSFWWQIKSTSKHFFYWFALSNKLICMSIVSISLHIQKNVVEKVLNFHINQIASNKMPARYTFWVKFIGGILRVTRQSQTKPRNSLNEIILKRCKIAKTQVLRSFVGVVVVFKLYKTLCTWVQ